jgi:hypothetical protein
MSQNQIRLHRRPMRNEEDYRPFFARLVPVEAIPG